MARVVIPEDFMRALEADEYIHTYFMSLPPSHKQEYVRWVEEAGQPETRKRRIAQAVAMVRNHQRGVGSGE